MRPVGEGGLGADRRPSARRVGLGARREPARAGRPPRRTGRERLARAAATAPAATAAPAATTASAADEQALAEKYAPVTRLVQQAEDCGPGEPFVPTDVDTLLGNDTVALRGPWDTDDLVTIAPAADDLGKGLTGYHLDFPGNPLNPGCSYEEWANEQTAGSTPTTYARVVTEPGREGLAVQYWLYYPFNDFNNKHESDWEMIQVEFAASDAATALTQEPTRVGYSQHEGVEIADWGDVKLEVVDGTHPVVHPAAGSHANYYDAALFLGRSGQQGFGCDDTRAPTADVRPAVALVPSDAAAVGAELPLAGLHRPLGPARDELLQRPDRPQHQGPVDRAADLDRRGGRRHRLRRARQRAVTAPRRPASFCGIVATGSDALRLAMNNPGRGRARAARARPRRRLAGAPHHLDAPPPRCGWSRRRSTGQVIAAVWRMYLRPACCSSSASACRSPSRRLLPGLATVWVDVDHRVAGRQRRASTAVLVASPGWCSPCCRRSPWRSVRRRRCSRPARSTRAARSASAARLRRRAAPRRAPAADPGGDRRRARSLLAVDRGAHPGRAWCARAQPAHHARSCSSRASRAGAASGAARTSCAALGQGRGARRPDQRPGAGHRPAARHRRSSSAPRCRSR